MSDIPTAPDVIGPDVPLLSVPEVADRLGQPLTRVHQMLRDGQLLAIRRDGVVRIPADFVTDGPPPGVVKGLTGTVTLLRDAGYSLEEIMRWLFEVDDSLPGTPIGALRSDRGREVKRRAQSMGY